MILKHLGQALLVGLFLCVLQGSGEKKWSWGAAEDKSADVAPRLSSPARVAPSNGEKRSPKIGSQETQGRTFGLFRDMRCRLGIGKCKNNQDQRNVLGGQIPIIPGQIPIFPGPIPIVPGPIPILPGQIPPYPIGPVGPIGPIGPLGPISPLGPIAGPYPVLPHGPIPLPNSGYDSVVKPPYSNQLPNVEHPPIHTSHPVQTVKQEHHHQHTHTHIHESKNESPYKDTGYPPTRYPPTKSVFSPTVIQAGSLPDKGHNQLGHNNNGYDSLSQVRPEAVSTPIYRPPSSFYGEECQCVLPHQCDPRSIVHKKGGRDISYLLNPRSEPASVLSNATYVKEHRGRRDVHITNRQPKAALSQTPNGRAIGGYIPGLSGCEYNYVCCRFTTPHDDKGSRTYSSCGRSLKSSIHGRVATTEYNEGLTHFGEYPWQGAILRDEHKTSVFVCGATLVSGQHVLTAAHCIADEPQHSLRVRLGDWDVNSVTEFYKHVEFPIRQVVIHPKYYPGNLDNDIAIITFEGYIDPHLHPHISPVCLPTTYSDFTYKHCTVTGWGKNAFGYAGDFQQILKKVDVPIVDRQSCQHALQQARLGPSYYLPDGFICAGGEQGKDTCEGDGGGPLVCNSRYNTYELAGIVSWGIECGLPGVPGVYVNIPYYVDWINQYIQY